MILSAVCLRFFFFLLLQDNNPTIYNITKQYPFGMVIYLLSVYWLEYLRLQMCCDVSTFNKLFDYLEDKALQSDKMNVYECISCIVIKLFTEFCNAIAIKPKTKERDQNLETIAIILLIGTQCGNFRIFLLLRFYVISILMVLEAQKL